MARQPRQQILDDFVGRRMPRAARAIAKHRPQVRVGKARDTIDFARGKIANADPPNTNPAATG